MLDKQIVCAIIVVIISTRSSHEKIQILPPRHSSQSQKSLRTATASTLSKGFVKKGKRFRGIKLFEPGEMKLLVAISSGDSVISGFTNGDISERLYGSTADRAERLRRSNRIAYRFRLLRAHGLIQKIPKRNRYRLSAKGREWVTAIMQLQSTSLQTLNSMQA